MSSGTFARTGQAQLGMEQKLASVDKVDGLRMTRLLMWLARFGTLTAAVAIPGWEYLVREHPRLALWVVDPTAASCVQVMEPVGPGGIWFVTRRMAETDFEVLTLALERGRCNPPETNWWRELLASVESHDWFLSGLREYQEGVNRGGVSLYFERVSRVGSRIVLTNGVMVLQHGEIVYHYPPLEALDSPRLEGEQTRTYERPPWESDR